MATTNNKIPLLERILTHHSKDKPRNGSGGTLEVVAAAELGQGVVCVYDSDGEFDIFFDVNEWELANEAQGIYGRLMLDAAKKGIKQYKKMKKDYGMVCIVQDRWNPASYQGKSNFSQAHEAAQALLFTKQPQAQLYSDPIVVFPAFQDSK